MTEPDRHPTRTDGPGCGLIAIIIVLGWVGWILIMWLIFDWLRASLA